MLDIWSRVAASVARPPPPPSDMPSPIPTAATSGLSSEQTVTGMVLVRVIIDCRRWRRSAQLLPSHTDEIDADDAEDNDAYVLLACWYSECECW